MRGQLTPGLSIAWSWAAATKVTALLAGPPGRRRQLVPIPACAERCTAALLSVSVYRAAGADPSRDEDPSTPALPGYTCRGRMVPPAQLPPYLAASAIRLLDADLHGELAAVARPRGALLQAYAGDRRAAAAGAGQPGLTQPGRPGIWSTGPSALAEQVTPACRPAAGTRLARRWPTAVTMLDARRRQPDAARRVHRRAVCGACCGYA